MWVSGYANSHECCQLMHFGVYFDTTLLSENSRNIHLLHKNNDIVAKPLLGSLGKIDDAII